MVAKAITLPWREMFWPNGRNFVTKKIWPKFCPMITYDEIVRVIPLCLHLQLYGCINSHWSRVQEIPECGDHFRGEWYALIRIGVCV